MIPLHHLKIVCKAFTATLIQKFLEPPLPHDDPGANQQSILTTRSPQFNNDLQIPSPNILKQIFENHLFKSKIAYFLHFRHRYLNTYHKDFSYLNYFVLICETLSRCSDLCCHLYNSHTIHIAYDPMLKHKLHGQFGIRTTANYSIKPHHYT